MVVPLIAVGIAAGLGGLLFGKRLTGVVEETGGLIKNISSLVIILIIAYTIFSLRKL